MLAGIKQQAAAQGRGEDIGMTEEEARAMLRAPELFLPHLYLTLSLLA